MKRFILAALFAPCLALAAPARPSDGAPADGPMGQLRGYNQKVDKLLHKKASAGASAEAPMSPADRATLTGLVDELFDFRELARRALAQSWDKLAAPKQEEFVKTLQQMIEKTYGKRLRSNVDYQVAYKNEALAGDAATVATVIKVKTRGKSTDMSIDYKMHHVGPRWLVYDVITDEVSMVQNYRTQFSKIIASDGFEGLLKKMRKRIEETDAAK